MPALATFKRKFDPELQRVLRSKIRQIKRHVRDRFFDDVFEHTRSLGMEGGKRLRPYLFYLMYRAARGRHPTAALRLSCAFELFHLFALIHDDIIDHGTTRHGLATLHRYIAQRLRSERRLGELTQRGEAQALLVGDLLFQWSIEQFYSPSPIPPQHIRRARELFFRMINEVIAGQMIDVDLTTRQQAAHRLIQEKMDLKTASYTFIRPLQCGVATAGGSRALEGWCERFGLSLGLAFQIQDDWLDLTSTAAHVHKTIFSDLQEHQHTVFTDFILRRGTSQQKRELQRIWGKILLRPDYPRVRSLFQSSGALDYGVRMMNRYFAQAESLIRELRVEPSIKQELAAFVTLLRGRSS